MGLGTSIKFERAGGGVVATNERASSLRPPEAEGRRHGSGAEGAEKFYRLRHFVACDILSHVVAPRDILSRGLLTLGGC